MNHEAIRGGFQGSRHQVVVQEEGRDLAARDGGERNCARGACGAKEHARSTIRRPAATRRADASFTPSSDRAASTLTITSDPRLTAAKISTMPAIDSSTNSGWV